MSKQVNDNIGTVACSECGNPAALRRNRAGKLYYDCLDCGRLYPNMEGGQQRLLERANVWGADGPPPGTPVWIAEQWTWGKATRNRQDGAALTPEPAPLTEPPPLTGADPVNVHEDHPPPPPEPSPAPEAAPETVPEVDPDAAFWGESCTP